MKNNHLHHFSTKIVQSKDSYPIYCRRDDEQQVSIYNATSDNHWVVPYNPYLLTWYNCHINVEGCSSIKVVKYIYRYTYKRAW